MLGALRRSASLRYALTLGIANIAPSLVRQHVAQDADRILHVAISQVEWREAEAQGVRLAEVADHAAVDQGAHDRIAMHVAKRDMAAASSGIARARQAQAKSGAAPLDQRDEYLSELPSLALDVGDVEAEQQVDARFERAHAEHAGGSADEAADALCWPVTILETEWCRMT